MKLRHTRKLTKKKVEITGNVFICVGSFFSSIVSKVSGTLVLTELVDSVQNQGNHSLQTQKPPYNS